MPETPFGYHPQEVKTQRNIILKEDIELNTSADVRRFLFNI